MRKPIGAGPDLAGQFANELQSAIAEVARTEVSKFTEGAGLELHAQRAAALKYRQALVQAKTIIDQALGQVHPPEIRHATDGEAATKGGRHSRRVWSKEQREAQSARARKMWETRHRKKK